VILVEPGIAANLGFCARVLATAGLDDWVQVGGVAWRRSEAERTGAMALPQLEALRVVPELAAATEGCTHLLGLTARAGRHRQTVPLPELAGLRAEWGGEARVGLVFGREDRGLETIEVEACTALCNIPTRGLSSLNLSHALAVTLYEWFRNPAEAAERAGNELEELCWADAAQKARAAEKARVEIDAAGFREVPEHLEAALRRLAALPLQARDLRILERIVRHARWLREGAATPPPD